MIRILPLALALLLGFPPGAIGQVEAPRPPAGAGATAAPDAAGQVTPLPAADAAASSAVAASTEGTVRQAGTPADPLPPDGVTIEDFLWTGRPLIIFATSESDPAFQRQMQLLSSNPGDLADRQVVVITDTDPATLSDLRRRFRPNGFTILLIDTNGRPLLTRPTPRTVREISATIDKSPQRRQEIQDRRFQQGGLPDGGSGG